MERATTRFVVDVRHMHTPTITFTLNATIAVLWSACTSALRLDSPSLVWL